uniref:Uncharacterized protein n=1 Tax=Panagrolaimus superbus TaxID=310955 RepID=A0A914XVA6_9BILA
MNQLPLLLFRHETYLGVVANAITISPSVGRFSLFKDFEEVEFEKVELNRSEDATGNVVVVVGVDEEEDVGEGGDGREGEENKFDSK